LSVDEKRMRRALALAERGRYSTSPNPLVGAVLVRNGDVVGQGWHREAGGPHAEIEALSRAGGKARGSTLYVTLEPCAHRGRTGPCADALLEAGVSAVVAARRDPNPRVAGRGLARLRRGGVRVSTGVLAAEAARQNERFDRWIVSGRPFVLAKAAVTLDGRMADSRGRSRWITGREARRRGLEWREEYDAVLVGAGTAIADDPRLTRRLGLNHTTAHRRIVLDGRFRVPESCHIFDRPEGVEVWTATEAGREKEKRLTRRGVAVIRFPAAPAARVDLRRGLARLGREGVTGLLVEGGPETLTAFREAGLIDRWAIFFSPRLLGGGAPAFLGGKDRPLSAAERLSAVEYGVFGEDLLVTGLSH
jgi:diaminohydroxyphosphoribosylaminopyrimidine deaminase / 5-amino-6-(5-phosphoribosylamino)uracil reductase